jgi:hypothetical protein
VTPENTPSRRCPPRRHVQYVVGFVEPYGASVWLATARDAQRDAVEQLERLREEVATTLSAARREETDADYDGVAVHSQETADRDYEGRWSMPYSECRLANPTLRVRCESTIASRTLQHSLSGRLECLRQAEAAVRQRLGDMVQPRASRALASVASKEP